MQTKSLLLLIIVFCNVSLATEPENLILVAPDGLGKKLNDKIVISVNSEGDAVSPTSLRLDLKSGVVIGMTVDYPRSVSVTKMRSAINNQFRELFHLTQYTESELGGRWRNADGSLLIMCLDDVAEDRLQIIYLGARHSKFKDLVTEVSTSESENSFHAVSCSGMRLAKGFNGLIDGS